jgi:hypothetical protein
VLTDLMRAGKVRAIPCKSLQPDVQTPIEFTWE